MAHPIKRAITALSLSAVLVWACGTTTELGLTVEVDQWSATCQLGIAAEDCEAVARQFINHLGFDEGAVRIEAGGKLFVEPTSDCRTEIFQVDQERGCWRVRAQTEVRACMVFARSKEVFVETDFYKIRGDSFARGSIAEPPPRGSTPC